MFAPDKKIDKFNDINTHDMNMPLTLKYPITLQLWYPRMTSNELTEN